VIPGLSGAGGLGRRYRNGILELAQRIPLHPIVIAGRAEIGARFGKDRVLLPDADYAARTI
jgi:hypothetical protein